MTPSPLFLPSFSNAADLVFLEETVRDAGRLIMDKRASGALATVAKPDGSPVTAADKEAQTLIEARLRARFPVIPIVGEESVAPTLEPGAPFWLLDPLDGTRDFVAGGDQFAVSLGLIAQGRPTLGVVYAPALDRLYYGDTASGAFLKESRGAKAKTLRLTPDTSPARLIVSKRERRLFPFEAWHLAGDITHWDASSSAVKFGLIAEDRFNLFLHQGPTCEWDTAAGHALLLSLGGNVQTPDFKELSYGKPGFLNGAFFAASPGLSLTILQKLAQTLQK